MSTNLFAFFTGMPGPFEMIVIALIALLLFGNRLPSVMRSMGKGITEFKKGVNGIEDEVNNAASGASVNEEKKSEG